MLSCLFPVSGKRRCDVGTRSDIIVHRRDGMWARVYCHWDGYLSHNGAILQEHYSSQDKAEELVSHGDLSSLAPECSKPEGHSYDNRVEGFCVYYGRDRGEKGTEAKVEDSLQKAWPPEDTWTEFTYVWTDGRWWVTDPDEGTQTLMPLSEALEADDKGINPVKSLVKTPFGAIAKRR